MLLSPASSRRLRCLPGARGPPERRDWVDAERSVRTRHGTGAAGVGAASAEAGAGEDGAMLAGAPNAPSELVLDRFAGKGERSPGGHVGAAAAREPRARGSAHARGRGRSASAGIAGDQPTCRPRCGKSLTAGRAEFSNGRRAPPCGLLDRHLRRQAQCRRVALRSRSARLLGVCPDSSIRCGRYRPAGRGRPRVRLDLLGLA